MLSLSYLNEIVLHDVQINILYISYIINLSDFHLKKLVGK